MARLAAAAAALHHRPPRPTRPQPLCSALGTMRRVPYPPTLSGPAPRALAPAPKIGSTGRWPTRSDEYEDWRSNLLITYSVLSSSFNSGLLRIMLDTPHTHHLRDILLLYFTLAVTHE
ncbi:unnamed protein product [Peniophora sp. CBMAI 1063]|nr:unnamed protein product [Peniophora sp. CBMAI 1063]